MKYPRLCRGIVIPNIDVEMRAFEHEAGFINIVKKSLMGYLRVNLTANLVEEVSIIDEERLSRFAGRTFDEFNDTACRIFIDGSDAEKVLFRMSRETLLELFKAGDVYKFIEYRCIKPDGSRCWIRMFINIRRHPISGDIYLFCYFRDNDSCHKLEAAAGGVFQRDANTMLYTRQSMETFANYILSVSPRQNFSALLQVELVGLDRVREEYGVQKWKEIAFTFGRICRIAVGRDVITGQYDENKFVLMRADAGTSKQYRNRVTALVSIFKEWLAQAHPEAKIELVSGFAIERAGETTYAALLKKAAIACRSAAMTLGEVTVEYSDTGVEESEGDGCNELAERYRILESRYQQLANLLTISENDELTGLLGRQAFYRRVRELLDENPDTEYAIIIFDINRFKVYNDVRGTAAGDRLLRDIADRIRQSGDAVLLSSRLEADHFAMLVVDDPEGEDRQKETLNNWLVSYAGGSNLTFSSGIYRVTDRTIDVSFMCDRAILAASSVKNGFETRTAYYDAAMRDTMLEEQRLVDDMASAIDNGQFKLYFQPQVNYDTGALIGAEALVRWQHPTRGLLTPDQFIPLFERNSKITLLDEYVWERCCEYMRRWLDLIPQAKDLELSISANVSRLDIRNEKLCEMLCSLTKKYGLSPSMLRLEITESAYMEDQQQLIRAVEVLHRAGFTVEMDDFGSGYSSLNTLKDVYVDTLKLDMNFLTECMDSARGGNILSSVIRMAHWLKLPIIAEGVETKYFADYLKTLGCIYMQGYYFARPMPVEDFEKLLSQSDVSRTDKYKDTNVEGMAEFWNPSAQMALLFNSYVGGAAIMEYRDGVLEITRANDNFYKVLGTTRGQFIPLQNNILATIDAESRAATIKIIEGALASGEECYFEIKTANVSGSALAKDVKTPWMANRMRLLVKDNDRAIFYTCIENITERKRLEQEREVDNERAHLLMKTTGLSLFDYSCANDTLDYQIYVPGIGVTKRTIHNCSASLPTLPKLEPESAKELVSIIRKSREGHIDGTVDVKADLNGFGMRWIQVRYASIEDAEGRPVRILGQTNDVQEIKDKESLSDAIGKRLMLEERSYDFNVKVVGQISTFFYNSPDIDEAITATLSLLGEYYDLSRVYICEDVDGHTASTNSYEWCAPGIESQKEHLEYIRYEDVGGWEGYTAHFDSHGVFYCPTVSDLPDELLAELEGQGIRAMLQCAVMDRGVFSGMIGYDECRQNRGWTDEQVETLQFVSRIISTYLLNMRKTDSPIKIPPHNA